MFTSLMLMCAIASTSTAKLSNDIIIDPHDFHYVGTDYKGYHFEAMNAQAKKAVNWWTAFQQIDIINNLKKE